MGAFFNEFRGAKSEFISYQNERMLTANERI